jgi:predicted ATPase
MKRVAKGRTFLLVLEDLHWLDPSSLALLSFIARRREAARLMLIGTYRSNEVERLNLPLKNLQQELEMHRYCRELALPFLDQPAVGEYLSVRFETPRISPELLTTVHSRSDGNPLFMVNVTDYLVNRGAIVRGNGSVSLNRLNEEERIPATLSNLIDQQFELLEHDERDLLTTASVAGTTFSAAAIAGALGRAHSDIENCFQRLAARNQFVQYAGARQTPTGKRTARYSFIHALHQNAIYEQLGETRRAHLHKAIAERIEGAYQGATETVAAELALHFARGGEITSGQSLISSTRLA